MDTEYSSYNALVRSSRLKHFPKGQIVYYQDDALTEAYVLKDGIMKVYDIDDQGNEKILHLLKKPSVLPFVAFASEETPVQWFYAALTDCDVYALPAATLMHAIYSDSSLAIALTKQLHETTQQLLTRLSSIEKARTPEKLLAAIKFLGESCAMERRNGWRRIQFAVTQQMLADMAGVTRESAAMGMRALEHKRMVRVPKFNTLEVSPRLLRL
jgi:CRP/FNR family cyclic AMP-dependent transcriptional regulator